MMTIGDWTQYAWLPDGASSFPARVRLRDAAWMVYYEPDVVVERERAENAKLRELVRAIVCATDPHDRERLIINAAELLGEVTT